jgi:hypothetical protein
VVIYHPGESLDIEDIVYWKEIKETMADLAQARFYEIMSTGTKNL